LIAGNGRSRAVDTPAARLVVDTPTLMREGVLLETRITVVPRRGVADLQIGIPPALCRDFTISTLIPAPAEESFAGGLLRLGYGSRPAGDPLEVKIDGQINPEFALDNAGEVVLFDGDTRLASLPLRVRVLP
jgi:hypothetical protein